MHPPPPINVAWTKLICWLSSLEERDYCNPIVGTDIKTMPCESSADVFFMLDNMPAEEQGNKEEIEIITQVAKGLSLGRNAGSISVLVNAQGMSNPSIVDDNNQQLNPPLYALAYNTTSSQCASCRAAWYDNSEYLSQEKNRLSNNSIIRTKWYNRETSAHGIGEQDFERIRTEKSRPSRCSIEEFRLVTSNMES